MIHRTLDRRACADLTEYRHAGGGRGIATARFLERAEIIEIVTSSGLRGRGGAGFPTGVKWRTVANAAGRDTTPVVINAAEGEPGTFKDRLLLRRNPYKVLEGALIAARALGASQIIVAIKASFTFERRRLRRAIDEIKATDMAEGVDIRIVLGPDAYLFGEETGLLEVIAGRQPFPRVTPPYRQGLADAPALVNNVETFANIPGIFSEGPEWFRSVGTAVSPGTIVCTISGATARDGVGEFPMGTSLSDVLDEIGGGPRVGHRLVAAVSGVANTVLPEALFATPLSYEDMERVGSGLGAAGFLVFDETTDPVSLAHGLSRFLAIESCGQCDPCKRDGLAVMYKLDKLRRSRANARDVSTLERRLDHVPFGARCFLASQHVRTVSSILRLFPEAVRSHLDGATDAAAPTLIAPIVDLVGAKAVTDSDHARKQPDWSYHAVDSGAFPAALLGDRPVSIRSYRVGELAPGLNVEPSESDDAFAPVRNAHRDFDTYLSEAIDAAGTDADRARARLDDLAARLRIHLDVTTRILYPTLLRAVPGVGDDAVWNAEHDATTAMRLIECLASARDGLEPAALGELTDELIAHVEEEERVILPLLREHLRPDELDQLGRALAQARDDSMST